MFGANSSLQQPSTVGHLENQMASALVLKSSSEYHFWFTTYVRYIVQEGEFVRPVYTKRQSQRCNIISAMMLAILFSLKTMESIQNGIANHFQATPLFSMKTVMLASLQSCHNVDADAWCKLGLRRLNLNHD